MKDFKFENNSKGFFIAFIVFIVLTIVTLVIFSFIYYLNLELLIPNSGDIVKQITAAFALTIAAVVIRVILVVVYFCLLAFNILSIVMLHIFYVKNLKTNKALYSISLTILIVTLVGSTIMVISGVVLPISIDDSSSISSTSLTSIVY